MRRRLGEVIVKCFTEDGCEYLDPLTVSGDGVAEIFHVIFDAVNKIGAKRLVIDPSTQLQSFILESLGARCFTYLRF